MKLELVRDIGDETGTLGILFDSTDIHNPKELCYTCEDPFREEKIMHETRIPAGVYAIQVRQAGGFHNRYSKPEHWAHDFHRGMLWLRDVPNFEWIYIHPGNNPDHSSGCILVGETRHPDRITIGKSRAAYRRVYNYVIQAALDDELEITIRDADR